MRLVYTADPILEAIEDARIVTFDTETSSLFPWRDGKILAGIGIKALDGESFYLPFRHKNSRKQAPLRELKRLCKALHGKRLLAHNPKFDLAVLFQEGIDLVDEDIICTVVLTRLVSEDESSYQLERLAKKYIDPHAMEGQRELKAFMRKMGYETYDQIPDEYICYPYVDNDLRFCEGLFTKAMPFIEKRELGELLALEQNLTRKLFRMEQCGFQLDKNYVLREFKVVSKLVADLETEVYAEARKALRKRARELKITRFATRWLKLSKKERAGELKQYDEHERKLLIGMECLEDERKVSVKKTVLAGTFDVHSPHDVKKIFEALGIRSDVKTKKGGDSWAKTALAVIDNPMAELVVRIRGSSNVKNYYENFLELMDSDCVIHCSFHQAGARTGRLSCREPNLQNIPRFEAFTGATTGAIASMKRLKKKQEEKDAEEAKAKKQRYAEAGRTQISFEDATAEEILSEFEGELFGKVRGAFVPRPGYFLLSVDWKQVELRIFADYAEEIELLRTFDLGLDVHRMTALAAFGSLPDPKKNAQMYKWVRNMGKQIAFGLLYGMGIALLAIEIGRSKEEAQTFMDRYFARFKNARKWIDNIHVECEGEGFVVNLWGRRRYLPKKVVYKAVNFLVQGTAADLMKDAIIRVYDRLGKYKTRLLATVHDEIIFEVPYTEYKKTVPLIIDEMQKCDRIKAKLRCDAAWAPDRWSQMYEDEYAELCDLGCETCKGKGQTVDLPGVPADTMEDTLLTALYENNQELLGTATVSDCGACDAKGYSLEKIKVPA